ncbi:MAG: LamG domain-containing protein [Verrucomicrobiales bacterium]
MKSSTISSLSSCPAAAIASSLVHSAVVLAVVFLSAITVAPVAIAQEPGEIPSEAYVTRYSFDDGSASDASDNGNDGTVVGASAGEGKVGGALEFDGSDDTYVEVPDLGEYDEVTVTAWIKVTGRVGQWRAIYNVDGWDTGWLHHQLYPDNRMGFSINANPDGGNQFSGTTYDDPILDEWHHSAVVYSSLDGVIRFYLDGELDRETEWPGGSAVLTNARIGSWDGGGRGFEGSIDEFAILNIAATADQVRSLAGLNGPRSLAEYSFDDGTATDLSGRENNATIVGAKAVTGELFDGMALEFDGSNNQYLEIPDLGSTDELTIAMWFQATGRVGEWRALYTVNGWSEGWAHYQITPANKIGFALNGNQGGDDRSSVTDFDASQIGLWHHSAVVYSAPEQKIRFYLDGQLESEADWGGNPATLGPARIGGWDGGDRGFQGIIDNVVIWRTAATAGQVVNLMGDDRSPRPEGAVIAAYSFDDGTASDVSGNGNDGTNVGATPADGMFGQALEFDGSDDVFVETPDLGEHEELTIATWFKMTGRTAAWRVIYSVNGWSPGWVHHQIHPNNMMEFSINSNIGGGDQFGTTIFDEAELDVWHHSAVVYSAREKTIQFYLDGELDNETPWGGNPALLGEGRIGAWDGGGRGFEGLLDEVTFLNYAATSDEVKAVMDNSLSGIGSFQIEKVAFMPASEGATGYVELSWPSQAGRSYKIETSPDFEEFEELTDGFESQGEQTTYRHENPEGPVRYYRVKEE